MRSDDVLLAKIVLAGATLSMRPNSECFSSMRSGIASITRSALPTDCSTLVLVLRWLYKSWVEKHEPILPPNQRCIHVLLLLASLLEQLLGHAPKTDLDFADIGIEHLVVGVDQRDVTRGGSRHLGDA